MAGESHQSKDSPNNTLRSTPAVIWVILVILTLLTLVVLLAPIIIAWITKSPYLLTTYIGVIPLKNVIPLGNFCERIVYAHFELNDKNYIIEERKANHNMEERQTHNDEDENKPSTP